MLYPHSTIHMHQVLAAAQGQAADVVIAAKEIMRLDGIIRTYHDETYRTDFGKAAA